MQDAGQSQSSNQILVMHLISKVFFSANNVSERVIILMLLILVGCRTLLLGHATKNHALDELLPERLGDQLGPAVRDTHRRFRTD